MEIIKNDGTEVMYDREKIILAIEKTNDKSQSIVNQIIDAIINNSIKTISDVEVTNCEEFAYKSRKWMKTKLQECKYVICKSKILKLLVKFAYDVAVGVLTSLISTLILTAILIKDINQSFFVSYI